MQLGFASITPFTHLRESGHQMKSENIMTEHDLPAAVLTAIRNGRKIEAIRILREEKSLGLANAKVLVEKAWRTHGPQKTVHTFADRPRGLSAMAKSMVFLLLIAAAYYFYATR